MSYSDKINLLRRTYWVLMIPDILLKLDSGYPVTKETKQMIHDCNKSVLGVNTTSDMDFDRFGYFLAEVVLFWAETKGIFVRTSAKQWIGIEYEKFSKVKHLL